MTDEGLDLLVGVLEEGRRFEKIRTVTYRALASLAEHSRESEAAERLNALHADEQHHLSRLTARLLELGVEPTDLSEQVAGPVTLDGWEAVERAEETKEVAWYEVQIGRVRDPETVRIFREILASERFHLTNLAGKWMPA